jgi:lipoprotein-anchoring transpeptidase ErfK/SrfK
VAAIATRGGEGYWLLRAPQPAYPPLPAGSGSGRRVVYSNPGQRVWLVESDGTVVRSYLVSGRYKTPAPGTYSVYSKSRKAYAGHDGITMDDMVRFARAASGTPIGFHGIPRYADGSPMQSDDELGEFRSAGCVRQSGGDAAFLYDWAQIGTTVVVLH